MDIFGKNPEDYAIVRAMKEANLWERYQVGNARRYPWLEPHHNFDALGSGVLPGQERASQDQQSVGYLTNNVLSIQTLIEEILYTLYRLPLYVHINTAIPDGARFYGIRVMDRVGHAQRLSAPGFEAPSATASESLVTQPIHWYGLDGEYSIDELRGAMMAGTPLDVKVIEAAVMGTLETMEAVGLTGGGYAEKGLTNLATSGTDSVTLTTQASNMTFSDLTAPQIRDLINGRISNVISSSKETLGRNITTGMTVYLPGEQYDLLTTKYIGDNAERTLMKSIMEDNPWTHFTKGSAINIERVLELEGAGASSSDRMIVALKDERVAEMGVSISPRVLRILDKGRTVCAQIEAKFSPLFVKRPSTIQYVDAI